MDPAADTSAIDRALDRARAFNERNAIDAARAAYLAVLTRAPDHLRALTDFGAFLLQRGYRSAAATVLERALALEPRSALAHATLGHVRYADVDYVAARAHYEAALRLDPGNSLVHQGLSYALARLGCDDESAVHRQLGFAGRALTTAPYRGSGEPLDVLLLVCAAGGTLYTETFLDDEQHRTTTLVADLYAGDPPLPHADVIFNAISDADRAAGALAAMAVRFATSAIRTINAPSRVLATTRETNAARLGVLPDVVAPRTVRVPRVACEGDVAALVAAHGFAFPLLVRAPGFHTGQHFEYVARADELLPAIAAFPGDEVLLIAFVDTSDAEGRVRKFRMLAIGGALYPLHLAIARQWKVHYFTAEMATDAANRAEDAAFLRDPARAIGARAIAALERIVTTIGLEYLGIDFGIDRAGRVVVFEANATMIVLPPGPEPVWDYRRAPVARIVTAVRSLLRDSQ